MAYSVYKHTSPNGKVYIGITSRKPEQRWSNGSGYAKNKHFTHAINKYGWENIKHEILFSDLTKEEACQMEIELIVKFKSNDRRYGYNFGTGGEHGATGSKWSEETRKNHMDAIFSKPRNHTEEEKQKISIGVKKYFEQNPQKKRSSTKNRTKKSNKIWGKKIICVETGDVFTGAKSAADWAGIKNRQLIYFCCEGVGYHKTAGGYHWEYVE